MLSFRELFDILWRRKLVIAASFLCIVILPVLLTLTYSPVYKASSELKIIYRDSEAQYLSNMPDRIGIFEYVESSKVDDTFFDLVRNPVVVHNVINEVALVDDDGKALKYKDALISGGTSLFFKSEGLSVSLTKSGAEIIEINGYSREIKRAVDIANSATRSFIDLNANIYKEKAEEAFEAFQKRIAIVNNKIMELEQRRFNELSESNIIDISKERELALTKYYDYLELYHLSKTALEKTRANYYKISKTIKEIPELQLSTREMERNPLVDTYKKQIVTLENSLSKLLVDVTKKHPDVLAAKEQIRTTKEAIKKEQRRLLSSQTSSRNSYHSELIKRKYDAKIDMDILKVEHKALLSLLDKSNDRLMELQQMSLSQQELSRVLTALVNEYTQLQSGIDKVKALLLMSPTNVSVLNYANEAFLDKDKPYFPNKAKILALCIFLWLSGVFAMIVLLESMDKSIRNLDELRTDPSFTGISFLKGLNTVRSKGSKRSIEAARNLIVAVKAGLNPLTPKITLFSGVEPKVGARALAESYARGLSGDNRRVLLIRLSDSPREGALKSGRFLTDHIRSGEIDGLFECTLSGKDREILMMSNIGELLRGLDYEHIVIESPSLQKSTDSLLISFAANAIIIVARKHMTSKDVLESALSMFDREIIDKKEDRRLWILLNQG